MARTLGTYDVGAQPEFTATCDDDGILTDPSTIKFVTKRSGSATETVYTYPSSAEIVRTSVGVYVFTHPQLTAADAGQRHTVRTNTSGAVTDSDEEHFLVRPTNFTTPLP